LNEAVSEESNDKKEKQEEQKSQPPAVGEDMMHELRDQQEYLEEWMDVAQRHMIAMRIYMEENDDDMDEYLDRVLCSLSSNVLL